MKKTIITSENYDGNYNKEDMQKYSKASISIYSKSDYELKNVDFLCNIASISVSGDSTSSISVNDCYFHNMVYFTPTGNLEGINSFCNNTFKNCDISSYAKELLISNNKITNGRLSIITFKNAKCKINNNNGVNDNGALLKLNLSNITSADYLADLIVNNKNLSISNRALDIQFESFPVSDGTLTLPKGNYLFFKNVTGYISNIDINCNLSVEAGSNINISKNAYIKTDKSLKFNGTEEENINIDCFENKILQETTSKWGKFNFLKDVDLAASYTNILNSGNWYSNAKIEKSAWITYNSTQGRNNKIKLNNVNVLDNNYGVSFINSNIEIKNSTLHHEIYLKNSLSANLQNNRLKEIKCDVNNEDFISDKEFICINNLFDEGANITYVPIDSSTCIIQNNTFNINKEYLNIDLGNCTTNPNKNILDNINNNKNSGTNKYNIYLKSIPTTNNLYLGKNSYYFNFENIDCDMEVEKGSNIYLLAQKQLNVSKHLKLLGTTSEKITIDTVNEQYWKGFYIKESENLQISNAIIRKTGMYVSGYNYSWIANSGITVADNITFENYIKKPINIWKNSYTQIMNTEIDSVVTDDYRKLDIKNCNISTLNLTIPTTIEELNETILVNNVINNSAIVFTPNIFSIATIKDNTINKLESPPLILTLQNANENILDNVSNNVSPDMGKIANMKIISLPETFTLRKGSYYLLTNLVGNKNIEAGCCIKLEKRINFTLQGNINLNGTKEEPITITSIEDNGLNNNLQDSQTWKYLYINSNSNINAKYVNIKNGAECAYISGNINLDNVLFDKRNIIVNVENSSNTVVTTNIKNSKFNKMVIKWNQNRNAQILNNIINDGTTLEYLPKDINFESRNNVSKGIRHPLYIQNLSSDYIYTGQSFENVSGNYNEDDNTYNAIYFLEAIAGYDLHFKGKFPTNDYYMPKLNVSLGTTCQIDKGSKIRVYKNAIIKEKNKDKEIIYSYDNNDNIIKIGNEIKTYDKLNRLINIHIDENQDIKYEYNDIKKEKKIIDTLGNIKIEKYDNENRLQKVIEKEEETEYTYNANGSLNKITNKVNEIKINETEYEYYKIIN